jgi:glycosyltransferase involved in cell wall biosynthesis
LFLKYKLDHFIAISKSVYKILNFRLKIPEKKISLIYNGVPISGNGLIDKNARDKKIYIINIGRLSEEKDQAKLIKSIYILKERFYGRKEFPFEVHIYGVGELKNHLIEKIKEYELEKYIFLKGVDYDVSEKLKKYDLFILSSNWEGFPLSILEAMAKKVVVISTNVGSVSEIIDDQINGILIKNNSAEEIAEKVHFLSNKLFLLNKLAENGYQKVKAKYDIRRCASEHIKLYTKLIK